MGTAEGLIQAMCELLGTGEDRGENHNQLTDWYADRNGSQYRATAWCDITVSYAAAASGNSPAVMGDHAWTVEHARAFQSAGRWYFGTSGIQPGDVIFFDWSGTRSISAIDHVGVVEAVNSNGSVTTIEGNIHDRVDRMCRWPSDIVGFGRPDFTGSPDPVLPPGPAPLQVDGEFGPLTTRALQRMLNGHGEHLDVDGEFGPLTTRALQRYLGVADDGEFGPISTRALQRRVGLGGRDVDGEWGPVTTSALQRALNAGAL